jgi:hypothetical protein
VIISRKIGSHYIEEDFAGPAPQLEVVCRGECSGGELGVGPDDYDVYTQR